MQNFLRAVLEGRRGGFFPFLLRGLLFPFGVIYGMCGLIRAHLYKKNWFIRHTAALPVISVGNITAGGTGKTPFVVAIARLLETLNFQPAVVMRGYGAKNPAQSDEVLLYHQLLPEVKVYADSCRARATDLAAVDGAKVVLLDDGFQHLQLNRVLDIVLLDATCPFGGGLPLPAGLLREFLSALHRASLIVLTHSDQTSQERIDIIKETLRQYGGDIPIFTSVHRPTRLTNLNGATLPLDYLTARQVIAVSGIGRPDVFARTLRDLGAEVCAQIAFADHQKYTAEDFERSIARHDYDWLPIVTEKDAVKLSPLLNKKLRDRILVLGIDLRIANLPLLRAQLEKILQPVG